MSCRMTVLLLFALSSVAVAETPRGDYGPGDIGTAVSYAQGGGETGDLSSTVAPEVEGVLMDAMCQLLGGQVAEKSSAQERRGTYPDWAYRMRIFNDQPGLRKLPGEEFIQKRKAEGVNMIILGGGAFNSVDTYLRDTRDIKRFVDACHKEGIRVVLHCMGLSRYTTGASTEKQNCTAEDRKRATQDAQGRSIGASNYWWYCPNSPHRLEFLTDQGSLYQLITRIGVDGYFDDWSSSFRGTTACACKACREKFTAETGNVLPEDPRSPVWNNFDDPTWRSFLVWRNKTVADFMVAVREKVRKTNPEFILQGYGTSATVAKDYAQGEDYNDWAGAGTILGLEECYEDSFYGWPWWLPDLKYMFGLASFHRAPPGWIHPPLPYDKEAPDFFVWAQTKSHGLAFWPTGGVEARQEGFPFEARHEDLFDRPQPFGNIGVVFSAQTRKTYRAYDTVQGHQDRYVKDWKGWCHVLSEANLAYNVLPDAQVEAGQFNGYRLLILVNAACLSKTQVEQLRRFVQQGGSLIATGETSLYDPTGKRLDNFALSDVLGVDSLPAPANGARVDFTLRLGDDTATGLTQGVPKLLPHRARQVPVRPHAQTTVLGEFQIGGASQPAIVLARCGKGKVLYLAGKPGYFALFPPVLSFYRLKSMDRWTWQDSRVPGYERLILNAVDFSLEGQPSLKTQNLPKGVAVNALRIGGNRLAVHLLNAIGGEVKPGMQFDKTSILKADFPEVQSSKVGEPMTVLVHERIAKGYLVSPDFEGRREATAQEAGNGYWSVSIPSLHRYSVLVLEHPSQQ